MIFKKIMHYIITFATVVVPNMSNWGYCKEIERLNSCWSTFSYNFEKINKKKMMIIVFCVNFLNN